MQKKASVLKLFIWILWDSDNSLLSFIWWSHPVEKVWAAIEKAQLNAVSEIFVPVAREPMFQAENPIDWDWHKAGKQHTACSFIIKKW